MVLDALCSVFSSPQGDVGNLRTSAEAGPGWVQWLMLGDCEGETPAGVGEDDDGAVTG